MSRVGLAVGGFNGTKQDYMPMAYTYTPETDTGFGVHTQHPLSIPFVEFFQLYANIRTLRVYGDLKRITSGSIPFDFTIGQFQTIDTTTPANDVAGPSDELEIATLCSQPTNYGSFGDGFAFFLQLADTGFESSTEEFSPYFLVTNGEMSSDQGQIPGLVPSGAATCSFFGHSITLYEVPGLEYENSITIEAPATDGYWTYDDIWNANTGAQLISPIPTGF